MFSYYGSKSKIIGKYPEPTHNLVIEPFAGSAQYALRYYERKVVLVEKYDKIFRVWKYLQQAQPKDVTGLPDVSASTRLEEIDGFSQLELEEKWLIGLCSNQGSASPKNVSRARNGWNRQKHKIASNLHKIRHWDIRLGSYETIENTEATWFIDPPYQIQGKWYTKGCKNKDIDYLHLSEWCRSRDGQVIVCENKGADWLDFKPLVDFHGQIHKRTEVIWTKP